MSKISEGQSTSGDDRIGFCGLGTMGAAMAANILRAGFPLTVWNRTPGRAAELVAAGAAEAGSPRAVAERSDIVLICVSDSPDVEAVLFAADGVAHGADAGDLIVDCSTISPAATREFASRLGARGVGIIDAPVSGGSEGAINGTLSVMAGGEEGAFERARPVLGAIGRSITLMGPVGAGQATKAVNQVILCGAYLGVAEGIVLAMRSGLDPRRVVEALGGGAAGSWVLENRGGRMIDDEYPLGFKVALHLKDLVIALAMARELGVDLPVASLTADIEERLVEQGHGEEDVSALAREIRARAGL